MKNTLIKFGFIILLSFFTKESIAQFASIQTTHLEIIGVLDGHKVGYATNTYVVKLNKQTGVFTISVAVDDLTVSTTVESYQPDTTINAGKYVAFRGVFPVQDFIEKRLSSFEVRLPVIVAFNGLEEEVLFIMDVFLMANDGFNIVAKGHVLHRQLQIENLELFEDDLIFNFNFVGY